MDVAGGTRVRRGTDRFALEGAKGADRLIAELAEEQHGVVARRQLMAHGIRPGAIDSRRKRGQLHRLYRGVYAVGHPRLTRHGRWLAAVLACGPEAVLSRRSAGQLWGFLPPAGHAPEVTRRTEARIGGWVVTHRGTPAPDEVGVEMGIPVTSPFRTVLDLAEVLPRRQLERALNEIEVRRITDRLSLYELIERYPRRRGVRTLRGLLESKEPGGITRNDLEEAFVALLDEHRLPRPRLNATLALRGRFFEPDCMWERQRLLVELDGRATHGTERAFERDRQRDRTLLVEGWRSARVTWRQLRDEPRVVAADLRKLLTADPAAA